MSNANKFPSLSYFAYIWRDCGIMLMMKMRTLLIRSVIAAALLTAWLPVRAGDLEGSRVSPLYFGPNALPVPDILDGRVSEKLYLELDYDWFAGHYGDMTHTLSAKVRVPLFTPRVNLSVWMPVVEGYRYTPEALEHFRPLVYRERGTQVGNVYVSTDIQVFRERRIMPGITVRAAVITASGDGDEYSRYFDAPGYFFDASVGKSLELGHPFFHYVRVAAGAGFLCWQVTSVTQNDAWMYGLSAALSTSLADARLAWQGYNGWMGDGDRPMVIQASLTFKAGGFRPVIAYEYGLRDWPYSHLRIGLAYEFQ